MGKIAFVFAGQGAQQVGMGRDFYETFPAAKAAMDLLPQRLLQIMFDGPAEELNQTANTQPCLFVTDLACAKLLNENGVFANAVAGFSLGEIPALAYSGLMTEEEAFDFVCLRGAAMQACADMRKGTMFAVLKLKAAEVETVCDIVQDAYPVNYNWEGQTVVACGLDSADALVLAITKIGGKAIPLAVSGAFHSPLMAEAAAEIETYLSDKTFGQMKVPLYSNVTAQIYNEPKMLPALQVKRPVLWQKTIENMISDGIDTFIEVGPGKTLSGLIKKINGDVKTLNVCDVSSLENTLMEVRNA
ncbi:Malonyl CoA-acyl carrier protein transacylase [bioreactor metagenome]|uniref:[acyl-carrier-protein] S-malonyltransferase n=1 Tax=bioreactor metagenome TaxID=1076179 RepID=A0A644ZC43_9ZZZZ